MRARIRRPTGDSRFRGGDIRFHEPVTAAARFDNLVGGIPSGHHRLRAFVVAQSADRE
ncbi:hypothetical protein FAGKG844_60157 [Frankia sp. AgKG'84/4]